MSINIENLPDLFYKNTFEVLILNEELLAFCQSNKNWFEDLFKLDFVKKLSTGIKSDISVSARKYARFVSPQLSKEDQEFLYKTFCSSTLEELKVDQKFKEVFFLTYFGFEPISRFIREQRDKVYSDNINNQDFIEVINNVKQLGLTKECLNKYLTYSQYLDETIIKFFNFIELNIDYFDIHRICIFLENISNNFDVNDPSNPFGFIPISVREKMVKELRKLHSFEEEI